MKYTVYYEYLEDLNFMHVQAVITLDEILHNVHSDPKTCCATLNYGLSARFHCETVTFSSQHEIRDESILQCAGTRIKGN